MNNKLSITSVRELIAENGMGYIEGPFRLQCNGNKPDYRLTDWDGKVGDFVEADAIQVEHSCTIVYIGGVGYNSVGFV
jgi:hypothetical protein